MKPIATDALIGYLRDLGYQDIYRPRAGGEALPATDRGTPVTRRSPLNSAAPATGTAATTKEASKRAEQLAELCADALICTACSLAEKRNKVVFGSGNPDADLMLIGEGPGANEDRQGLPFVGPAGELLTKIIQAIELERSQVYIANVVKCRPPGNRDPKPEEVAACIGYLRQQVALVEPKVVVALGRVAAQALLACSTPIGRLRGEWYEFDGVPLRVTYHPAALLRNASLKRPTWDDMQAVRDRLAQLAGEAPDAD